jgi:hypothetical protein
MKFWLGTAGLIGPFLNHITYVRVTERLALRCLSDFHLQDGGLEGLSNRLTRADFLLVLIGVQEPLKEPELSKNKIELYKPYMG